MRSRAPTYSKSGQSSELPPVFQEMVGASRKAKKLIMSYLSCISIFLQSKEGHMTPTRRRFCDDRTFPRIDTSRRELSSSPCFFAFLVFAALICGGCQTQWPPLPYPPGPHTAVRLSPGDTIKVAFAENSDLDQTEKIRRDGGFAVFLIKGDQKNPPVRHVFFKFNLVFQ